MLGFQYKPENLDVNESTFVISLNLHLLYAFKIIAVISKLLIFSPTQIQKFPFQLMDIFFHCLQPFFQDFLPLKPTLRGSLSGS